VCEGYGIIGVLGGLARVEEFSELRTVHHEATAQLRPGEFEGVLGGGVHSSGGL